MNVDVINADAGLSTIKILPKQYPHDCTVHFCRLINNDRTFTTKFKNAWSEILGCLDGNKPSCGRWACKTYDIKGKFGDGLCDLNFSFYNSIKPLITKFLLESMYLLKSLARELEVYPAI